MKFEIKNKFDGQIIATQEAESLKDAVVLLINSGADLSWANLSEANLSGANLSGAYMSGADLSWANLSEANLSGADLRGAYMSGANLRGANLSWANLSEANLSGANLRWANLSGADLSGAYMSGAKIENSIIVNRTPIQIYGLYYDVTIWDSHMRIGCEFHALSEWSGFDDERIGAMDGEKALKFWRAHKATLLAMAESDGRK